MKTLRTLCILIILSGVIFFGLKINAKDIDIPFSIAIKKRLKKNRLRTAKRN